MEILTADKYPQYENFARSHKNGGITQSVMWHNVKRDWGHEVVVSRDESGAIIGGVSILVRKMPFTRTAMLYSPRGPVCDLSDRAVLEDLKRGVDALAKKHRAHIYKTDPDIPVDDENFRAVMRDMGFRQILGKGGFETIQARFNYRLYINGRDENALLANLTQQTRRNVRIAQRKGVEVKVMGKEALGDFMRLMEITGARDGFATRPGWYFERMMDSLGDHMRLYMAYYEGKAISGAVAANYAGKTCYLYGASDNANRNVMSTYLLQWEMIRWAVQTGCTVYDFQGVSGDMDENSPLYGLYRFKKGFNGTLDELAGEFDFVYMPIRARLVRVIIRANEWGRTAARSAAGFRNKVLGFRKRTVQ
ncbi:MAG: peptidoglycan bridge formation glycyltransferase FemA/FemB family protein [Oscillospiraceae bacterium]|nr:peptidoglycan bridge formation glycyltransferase FemA/FemB family protein [Oscillospiraceae bacterium]